MFAGSPKGPKDPNMQCLGIPKYLKMYIYIFTYTYAHIHIYIHTYIHVCIHMCEYMYACIYTYVYVDMNFDVDVDMDMSICTTIRVCWVSLSGMVILFKGRYLPTWVLGPLAEAHGQWAPRCLPALIVSLASREPLDLAFQSKFIKVSRSPPTFLYSGPYGLCETVFGVS